MKKALLASFLFYALSPVNVALGGPNFEGETFKDIIEEMFGVDLPNSCPEQTRQQIEENIDSSWLGLIHAINKMKTVDYQIMRPELMNTPELKETLDYVAFFQRGEFSSSIDGLSKQKITDMFQYTSVHSVYFSRQSEYEPEVLVYISREGKVSASLRYVYYIRDLDCEWKIFSLD
jgi:hypothetical protein